MTDLKTKEVTLEQGLLDSYYQMINEGIAIPADAPDIALDNYTRLQEGENRFRLISKPIYGAELWFRRDRVDEETGEVLLNDDKTPQKESTVVRYRPGAAIIIPIEYKDWQKDKPRRFLAMLVFNFTTNRVELLTASNKALFETLMGILKHNEDNLNPFKANFTITKKFDRKANINGNVIDLYSYTVRQGKESNAPENMIKALGELEFVPNMLAMYEGNDPFEREEITPHEELTADSNNGTKALEEAKKQMA